jgi:parvulin-like peptidyl-prolyl isomerase
MQKKYIIATFAAVIVLIAGAMTYKVHAEKNKGVAAVVNGETVTVAEIKEVYDKNPQIKAQASFEDFYNQAIDVAVNGKLALQAATAAKVQESDAYKAQIAELQDEVARQVYMEQRVNERVTDEAVQKVYDDYVSKFESEKEIKAKHILVATEKEAKDIIAKLEAKEASFDELARKFSKDQSDLG